MGPAMMPTQESTWCWLTNQNMQDFSALAYTRDNLPCACMAKHEGHRPKMFLWMLEEYVYILGWLHEEAEDHAAPPCCPSTIYQLAPQTPWSVPYPRPRTPHPWNTWHGRYMITSWDLENHCLSLAMKVIAKCCNTWWTMHTEDYIPIAWCTHQPYSNQKEG